MMKWGPRAPHLVWSLPPEGAFAPREAARPSAK
ncbi:MAG: hypothetical protein JWP65_932 [Ramlibacter sp.]|jgi:hypothetical protein|nr:hypothetical protein [Ramlibacter sp.]